MQSAQNSGKTLRNWDKPQLLELGGMERLGMELPWRTTEMSNHHIWLLSFLMQDSRWNRPSMPRSWAKSLVTGSARGLYWVRRDITGIPRSDYYMTARNKLWDVISNVLYSWWGFYFFVEEQDGREGPTPGLISVTNARWCDPCFIESWVVESMRCRWGTWIEEEGFCATQGGKAQRQEQSIETELTVEEITTWVTKRKILERN